MFVARFFNKFGRVGTGVYLAYKTIKNDSCATMNKIFCILNLFQVFPANLNVIKNLCRTNRKTIGMDQG